MLEQVLFGTMMENGTMTGDSFVVCTIAALLIGLCISVCASRGGHQMSRSYLMSLVLLPAIVELVIMLVNGNIGAGVAVAGAFALVRFRSQPGSSEEITSIFLAMAAGLACGMGYIGVAILFTAVILAVYAVMNRVGFGKTTAREQVLKITVPESLDFEGVFDDLLERYTSSAELEDVRTSGMGSLYKLTYHVTLREGASAKALLDDLRKRNGNLEVSIGRVISRQDAL